MKLITQVFIAVILIGCSTPQIDESHNLSQEEVIIDSPAIPTISFEGNEYVKSNDSIYTWTEDSTSWIFLTIHNNGKVKSVEHQGSFQACGMPVDTSKYYSDDETLIKTIHHDNWLPEDAEGCHETIQDQYITDYYSDGKIKGKRMFRNGYQDIEHKAGVWEEFDALGKLTSSTDYGDPYKE